MKHQDPMDDWLRGMFANEFDGLDDAEFANHLIKRLNRRARIRNLILCAAFVIGAVIAFSVSAEIISLFTPWIALADAKLQAFALPAYFAEVTLTPILILLLVIPWWVFSMDDA